MISYARPRTFGAACALATALALCGATPALQDGAVISNSGSTNTAPYTIHIRMDGNGVVTVAGAPGKTFTIDPATAAHFLASASAARANPGTPGHCMKSASFGTTTTVTWHNWTSTDLQCPPFSAQVAQLAHDANLVEQAAGVGFPLRRIRLPGDQRRLLPSAPASVEPSASMTPSMSPNAKSESQRP